MATAAWCGVAWCGAVALALAGCGGTDGGEPATATGSFEVRAVSAEARISELPTDAECPQEPLALNESGWICDDATSTAYLVEPASVTAGDVATVRADASEQSGSTAWELRLTFTATGAQRFAEVTQEASETMPPANKIAMVVDGEVVSAPSVMSAIEGGDAVIAGAWDEAKAEALAAAISGTTATQ